MHSGTTLLQQIMGRNPSVFISGGETRHFANLESTKKRFLKLDDERVLRQYLTYLLRVISTGYARVNFPKDGVYQEIDLEQFGIGEDDIDSLVKLADGHRDYTRLFRLTYDYLAAKNGKSRWLDKLPGYVAQADQILFEIPGAQIIELVRDPRDILASKKRRTDGGGAYDPIWDSLAWKSAVHSADLLRGDLPERILRIRYEDLVSDAQITVAKICNFLDLNYDPEMLSVTWINSTTADAQEVEQGIGTSAIGKWERELAASDILACQVITKQELRQNGYAMRAGTSADYLVLPGIALRSFFELFGRLHKRWRIGGDAFLMNVLSNYRLRLSKLIKQ
jgi:hypothetical protein